MKSCTNGTFCSLIARFDTCLNSSSNSINSSTRSETFAEKPTSRLECGSIFGCAVNPPTPPRPGSSRTPPRRLCPRVARDCVSSKCGGFVSHSARRRSAQNTTLTFAGFLLFKMSAFASAPPGFIWRKSPRNKNFPARSSVRKYRVLTYRFRNQTSPSLNPTALTIPSPSHGCLSSSPFRSSIPGPFTNRVPIKSSGSTPSISSCGTM
mmetsp:Transcript_1940/g.4257  ORF Transcript_1940/g.4257 Transcript_1940/m.4257 type:complete len:208 (-) Transcript_1940:291-914(-)